jgi:DNA topoisomerase IB
MIFTEEDYLNELAEKESTARLAFDESKHPRASDGEFGNVANDKGKAETEKPKEEKKKLTPEEKQVESDHKFEGLMEGKSESDQKAFRSARADGIAIPPAWSDVEYYGKDANTVARGRDAAGRRQVAENSEYRQKISDENNARISKDLTPRMAEIRDKLREDAKAGNEEAKVLYLITQSGFRIGGKGDGKAKIEAFGASSLKGEHVTSDSNGTHFDFLGKKGVRQQHSINDPVISDFVKNAKSGEPLFKTSAEKVRAAWQDKYGGAKVHDIRHVVATELASSELDSRLAQGRPSNEKEKLSLIKDVAKVVSLKLGNNAAQALGTYIDKETWKKI